MKLKFQRLDENTLPLPAYATDGSAGFDLQACLTRPYKAPQPQAIEKVGTTLKIAPGGICLIPTGFKCEFSAPHGSRIALKVYIRSSMALKGFELANSVGIIDADYRGELYIPLRNSSSQYLCVSHGDRIAQGILEACYDVMIEEGTVDITTRGEGGFGSTGS